MTARRVLWGLVLGAALMGTAASARDAHDEAARAAAALQEAVAALETADGARNRISALTATISAYEQGLSALREGLRQAQVRETSLQLQFDAKRGRVAQLLGVLSRIEADPAPLLLLHPTGPLGTARSGMMLSEVTPALQAEAEALRAELQELQDLHAVQAAAGQILERGLAAAQKARSDLSRAMSDRTELPRRFTEDPETLRGLLESADTLDSFAQGLALNLADDGGTGSFLTMRGRLAYPVLGTLILRPNEADATGVRRPGLVLSTRARALVTAPTGATIRYLGPLLDYGNVIVLEPGDGYLLIVAGLETVYGSVGEVIAQGAPLGLMGGGEPGAAEFLVAMQEGGGARDTETLYLELRQGAEPVDPTEWFAGAASSE